MTTFKENLLVKISGELHTRSQDGKEGNRIDGEMKLRIVENPDKKICITLDKLGWYGLGIQLDQNHTGKISCLAVPQRDIIRQEGESYSFSIRTTGDIVYGAMEDKLGVVWIHNHMSTVPPETFEIVVSGRFDVSLSPKAKIRYTLYDLKIEMKYQEGGLGWLDQLNYFDDHPELALLAQSTNLRNLSNLGNCHPDLEVNERTLTIQPVGFRSSNSDASPSGSSLNFQMMGANAVWSKCCINFNVLPIHYITNASLKTSSNINNIRASYTSPNANAIEVFFVDNNLPAQGGGVANACNSILGNIVMSDNNAGNPQLLAHELGHILGLGHPGATFAGCTEPDDNTVMTPSGSPAVPNSTNNTHWNCINIANPALSTSASTCCLTHDIPDTVIRDFPEDGGTEPNPGFPGRNFYSMSNVWNRQSNSAGGLNPDGTPEHEHPARFEADGTTPHVNYLFAKVDVLENLRVRDAEVRFYMKHPGAGGGAANLQLLGTAPITSPLTPTTSATVSIPWTVPSGTPMHSCVFAVVHTPAEPAQDITSLNWIQTEQLVRDDNDWAQRNLDIQNLFSNFGNISQGKISFAPIIIDYPLEEDLEAVPLTLELDIPTDNKAIRQLELIFPALDLCIPVKPGGETSIQLAKSLKPGSRILMIARADIDASKLSFGETVYPIGINPSLGKTEIVGYGFGMRMGKASVAINQLLDRALGAFHDFGEISGGQETDFLCRASRKIRQDRCASPKNVVEVFGKHVEDLRAFQKLVKKHAADAYAFADMDYAFDKFYKKVSGDTGAAFDALRDLIQRIEILNWVLYEAYRSKPLLADTACE